MLEYDYKIGTVVKMKKSHPCGGYDWKVLRIGADFRIECVKCGHTLMLPRAKFTKNVKKIVSDSL